MILVDTSVKSLLVSCLFVLSCSNNPAHPISDQVNKISSTQNIEDAKSIDHAFLSMLSMSGVFDAARQIGLDADQYLKPLAQRVDHNYRHYRWSVSYHKDGGIMISAMPPEEETGWTPWERWYKNAQGITSKESWVMYPLKNPTPNGIAQWYTLDEQDLMPRYLIKQKSLEDKLRLARIYDAASILGFNVTDKLIKPLSQKGREYYEQCRWVIIPHILGRDYPVIYILPPMNHADIWPWESWYTDGKTALIHHVHYTQQQPKASKTWKEYPGAPQRPPEIFGVVWYWNDDLQLKPSMADMK